MLKQYQGLPGGQTPSMWLSLLDFDSMSCRYVAIQSAKGSTASKKKLPVKEFSSEGHFDSF